MGAGAGAGGVEAGSGQRGGEEVTNPESKSGNN
jgi:hypothetical protein